MFLHTPLYFIYIFLLYLYNILRVLLIGHISLSTCSLSLSHVLTISTPHSLDGRTHFVLYKVLYVDISRKKFEFFVNYYNMHILYQQQLF